MDRILRRAFAFLALALIGGAGPVCAQIPEPRQPAAGQPGPQNPLVRPEHMRLAFLVGQWEEEINYADGEKGRGRWMARPDLGLFLNLRYDGAGREGPYRALGMLTWDREQQTYRMWWFDSSGAIGDYRGNWRDEDTLVLEHRGQVEGRAFRERMTYLRISPTELHTRIEQAWGDEEYKPFLETAAHRTGDAPRLPPPGQRPGDRPPRPSQQMPPQLPPATR